MGFSWYSSCHGKLFHPIYKNDVNKKYDYFDNAYLQFKYPQQYVNTLL